MASGAKNTVGNHLLQAISLFSTVFLTVSQTSNFRLFQTETLQTTISTLMKMAESSLKTPWEKEKLLIKSNFSFPHSVFKRLFLHTCKNQGLFGKGLTHSHTMTPFDAPGKQAF